MGWKQPTLSYDYICEIWKVKKKKIHTRIRNKRDFDTNFITTNPVLLNGEIVLADKEDNTMDIKIGDGITPYIELPYLQQAWLSQFMHRAIETIYPVGSVYISVADINPAELFSVGTWVKISDCFLVGAGNLYELNSTGGEAQHTLTVEEMPSHGHTLLRPQQYVIEEGVLEGTNSIFAVKNNVGDAYFDPNDVLPTGGGQSHNNMPPYIAVNIWKRIN